MNDLRVRADRTDHLRRDAETGPRRDTDRLGLRLAAIEAARARPLEKHKDELERGSLAALVAELDLEEQQIRVELGDRRMRLPIPRCVVTPVFAFSAIIVVPLPAGAEIGGRRAERTGRRRTARPLRGWLCTSRTPIGALSAPPPRVARPVGMLATPAPLNHKRADRIRSGPSCVCMSMGRSGNDMVGPVAADPQRTVSDRTAAPPCERSAFTPVKPNSR